MSAFEADRFNHSRTSPRQEAGLELSSLYLKLTERQVYQPSLNIRMQHSDMGLEFGRFQSTIKSHIWLNREELNMKWIVIPVLVLAGMLILIVIIGALLPKQHVASRSAS